MCGRYVQSSSLALLGQVYNAEIEAEDTEPRFNAAPSAWLPVVRERPGGARVIHHLRWGLVQPWQRDENLAARLINARAETLESKPSFIAPFARRRCIAPMDGFYEWRVEGKGKQPYYFYPTDDDVFSAAGLWERWHLRDGPGYLDTFAVITVESNALVGTVHPRMPVLLTSERDVRTWLNAKSTKCQLRKLLETAPVEYTAMRRVRADVNSTNNDGAYLIGEDRKCS